MAGVTLKVNARMLRSLADTLTMPLGETTLASLRRRLLLRVGIGLLLTGWVMGLWYSRLLNYDDTQSWWVWQVDVGEAPLCTVGLALLPVWLALRRSAAWLQNPTDDEASVAEVRRQTVDLPLQVACLLPGVSLAVATLGSMQLRWMAHLPWVEVGKNAFAGLPIGLLEAILVYLLLSEGLAGLAGWCDRQRPLRTIRPTPRFTLFSKVLAGQGALVCLSVSVMGLAAYTAGQHWREEDLLRSVPGRLTQLALNPARAPLVFDGGQVSRLSPKVLALALPQAALVIGGTEGCAILRQYENSLVAWHRVPDGRLLVAVVPLTPGPMALQETVLAGLATGCLGLLLAWLMAGHLSRPVGDLANLLGGAGSSARSTRDDELGDLAVAVRALLEDRRLQQVELAQANFHLRHKVQQRSREMREATAMFEVSLALTSTLQVDRVLQEVATQVCELTEASAAAILLRKHEWLELQATSGLQPDTLPRAMPADELSTLSMYGARPQMLRDGRLSPSGCAPLRQQGYKAMVAVPLSTQRQPVGVLAVYYRRDDVVVERDINLLVTLGGQAAIAIENARMYQEQQHVTQLMRGMLAPRDTLGAEGIEVGHRFYPSMLLSGDYYDIIPLSARRFGLVIADVAGKGPDAAIITARAKHVIQAYATTGCSPGRTLELLNAQLSASAEDLHLVTVFYAELDLDSGTLVYASAGHEPPILLSPTDPRPRTLVSDGVLVGVSPDVNYIEHRIEVESGTTLVLYTDGVTEARNPAGEFFGLQGLLDTATEGRELPAQQLVNRIYVSAHRYCQGHFADDLSLLVVRIG